MKILHLITTIDIGGAEKQLVTVAKEQVERRNEVTVVYLKDSPVLFHVFSNYGIRVFNEAAGKNPIQQVKIIRRLMRKEKYDVIHLHLPRAELVGSAASFPQRYFVSRHNVEEFGPGLPKRLSKMLSRIVTSRAHKVIAITNAVKGHLIKQGEVRDQKKISVIPYGVEVNQAKENVERSSNYRTSRITFGTLSRLVPQKNLECLIQAFVSFSNSHPGHKLSIAGTGILEKELTALAHKSPCSKSIYFEGVVEADRFLSEIDSFVLCSRYEGFGLVILEALQAKLPLLCSRTEAALEILGSDFPGFFDVGDVQALSDLMAKCLDPKFRFTLIEFRNEILARYSIKNSLDALDKLYANSQSAN